MDEFTISIEDLCDSGIRIDKFLANAMPEKSRSYYQKAIDSGFVLVNGKQIK
ncbi:MAG: RNA pseudouridine synthase, partial [Pseudobutyrivibrio sp.]|nr:RNA pseudouridine synthase [Pseudobutyrivibrio sp.]